MRQRNTKLNIVSFIGLFCKRGSKVDCIAKWTASQKSAQYKIKRIQPIAVCCSVKCVAVCCSVKCVAVCCRVLHSAIQNQKDTADCRWGGTESRDYFKNFFNEPEFCPWDLRLVPSNK